MTPRLVLVLVLGLAACSADPPPPEPSPASPTVTPVPLPPARASYLGVIVPRQSADLSFKSDGKLLSLDARLGDRIEGGALSPTLDDPVARADIDLAVT